MRAQPLLPLLPLCFALSAAAAPRADRAAVQHLAVKLEQILSMSDETQRTKRLGRFFESRFHFSTFESRVLQDAAEKFSKKQRATFSVSFRELLRHRFITALNAACAAEAAQTRTIEVVSDTAPGIRLTLKHEKTEQVLLHIEPAGGAPRITDITVSGVRLSKNYRGAVNGIIRRHGVPVLNERIKTRAESPQPPGEKKLL